MAQKFEIPFLIKLVKLHHQMNTNEYKNGNKKQFDFITNLCFFCVSNCALVAHTNVNNVCMYIIRIFTMYSIYYIFIC